MKKFVLVLGPQGSGKSTQAKQLAEFLGYESISTGDLSRAKLAEGDELGIKFNSYVIAGKLVPDELIEQILFPYLEKDIPGVILDGYPRNLNQLANFLNFIKANDHELSKVFLLEVKEKEFMKRLKLRAEIEKRSDETDDAIKARLDTYNNLTKPLLAEYEKLKKLQRIDGERSIEDIQTDLRSYFRS